MPRYSRSPRHRRRRSYSSSVSSQSRSRSRSPLRGNPKYHPHGKKTTRGRSYSRSPPRKDRGSSYKSSSSKQRGGRRSRSYTPEKRHYGGSTSKAKSRSRSPSHRNKRYRSPKRSPQRGGREAIRQQNESANYGRDEQADSRPGYQEGTGLLHQDKQVRDFEGPQLPPGHNVYREEYGKGVQAQDQLPQASRDVVYDMGNSQRGGSQSKLSHSQPSERSYSKEMKYEAVSPDDLRFSPKSAQHSESPYDRKISKPKAEYYQVQEKYSKLDASGQGNKPAMPTEPQNAKVAPAPIIRPIFDPYSVKIPRRKDEGLTEIFDRPELKARFASEQLPPDGGPEPQKKEPVVYRQDVHFTGTLPSGALPPQAQSFIEKREPVILGFEPRRETYQGPSFQFAPRVIQMGLDNQYPAQPSTYQVQPLDQYGPPKEVQPQPDFNRQAMFVQNTPPVMQDMPQSPISYQYPPDDMPDIKGPHDLRYDLDSRRKQMEQQQQQGQMRSLSRSRSRSRSRRRSPMSRQRSRSRSRSRSPSHQYKTSSYRHGRSRSRSEDQRSRDRRPVRERLGNVSKGSEDSSFSDGNEGGKSLNWSRKQAFYHQHDRREDRSRSSDRDSVERNSKYRGAMRGTGTYRGGRGRGRGYLGKNFIPGYDRSNNRGNNRSYNRGYNHGVRGRYTPRGRGLFGGSGGSRSLAWTHDMFDKEKEETQEGEGKKEKKKAKNDKGKEKKSSVKQKSKTVKKAKKVKKSPSRTESGQKNKEVSHAPESTNTAS
ncbi:bcl-2-associated transcription factor 1-like isoform X1 [Patiria miniata]|uniref:Uncharacterized protein n=1 Tax=Patiria miniata TaxID=46514 RepID=A0A913ZKE5_PATMI|nr:bcl-2-associated transcription factor 1-like isoform X1 [Patiria miniata]XP_038052265.1 bcl-2-associated transcription factor 1-like isoform X1 [Patiria miniata]